jgi:AcrR family transcriptional regulator
MRSSRHEHFEAKRQNILAAAVKLVLAKGYEAMSVQDLIDALAISKGAFFHYFRSKADLLEAIIGQMLDAGMRRLTPIVEAPGLPATEKLNSFFAALVDWKTGNKSFFLSVVRVWYGDENAVVRQKLREQTIGRMGNLLGGLIRLGIAEKSFDVDDSDQAGGIVVSILENMTDNLSKLLLAAEPGHEPRMAACVTAHTRAIEKILGVPGESIRIMDTSTLAQWYASPENAEGGTG